MRAYRRRSSADSARPFRDVRVTRRELDVGAEEPDLLLAREHGLAVRVPATVELARVAVGPLLRHVVRRVRGAGRVVHEERLLGRVDVRVQHVLDRLVGEILAEVVALLRGLRLRGRPVVERQVRIPLVGLAAEEAVEAFEAAPQRPAVQRAGGRVLLRRREMPFPEAERVVAVRQQHLGQHPVLKRHPPVVARVAGRELHDAGHAAGVVVAAGHDARTRRRAQRGRVHVRVAQAGRGHAIDVGGLDQAAEAVELPVPDVVEHEEQHVRGAVLGPHGSRPRRARLLHGAPDDARELLARRVLDDVAHSDSSFAC